MSVRVVARIRPLLKDEQRRDCIVEPLPTADGAQPTVVRLPNPKNASESYSFSFNGVYDQDATQQDFFDAEVSPTIKHLFAGRDITVFAYGVTGTGKTHTMRGGKSLQDRGVIPRMLSAIYRRGRRLEKDTEGDRRISVTMSYYEIYNDRVYDLFEPPEKRTPTGLPIRDNNGKTVVAGLTERPCTTLKEFEQLYDQANVNRSTGATKLNAHSSRSHAVLCVKVSQHHPDRIVESTVSAIDLAGSEDNRRTGNTKEALVESSSINKSLFVLAQCVEAISKKQSRIPYRESKMTRILGLGQKNGLTIMILNLAPVRSYHLDTLSSLNFANRTKKIEVRDIENEPIFRGLAIAKQAVGAASLAPNHNTVPRQPLKSLCSAVNIGLNSETATDKPVKAFSVFAERANKRMSTELTSISQKRLSSTSSSSIARPSKIARIEPPSKLSVPARSLNLQSDLVQQNPSFSIAGIEQLVNRMVEEKLASHALSKKESPASKEAVVSEEMQRRLEALEKRVEAKESDARSEGLHYLLMAKQHLARGEEASALRMYQLAEPFFPNNDKLQAKMRTIRHKLSTKRSSTSTVDSLQIDGHVTGHADEDDEDHQRDEIPDDDYPDSTKRMKKRTTKKRCSKLDVFEDTSNAPTTQGAAPTPRTASLLRIINSRDIGQIQKLKGIGAKKAEAIVSSLFNQDYDDDDDDENLENMVTVEQLQSLKGVGRRGIDAMRMGLDVAV